MFAIEYISVQLFTWVIGILVVIFLAISGVVFGVLNKRITSLGEQVTLFSNHLGGVTTDIAAIKTDIKWIRSALAEIKGQPAKK
jgi:hypothetical protein